MTLTLIPTPAEPVVDEHAQQECTHQRRMLIEVDGEALIKRWRCLSCGRRYGTRFVLAKCTGPHWAGSTAKP